MTIAFNRVEWNAWKSQLVAMATGSEVSAVDVQNCLQSLSRLEETQPQTHQIDGAALVSSSVECSASPSPARKDATTQLCTVHPINYCYHVLTKVKRERQVRRLTLRLGQLGAALYTVAEAFWCVLLRIHHSQVSSQRGTDSKEGDSEAAVVDATVSSSLTHCPSTAIAMLTPQVSAALRSVLTKCPSFNASLLDKFTSTPLASAPLTKTAATQTPNEFIAMDDALEEKQRQPFLCRRCRQDGRADYAYDKGHQRLTHTHARAGEPSRQAPGTAQITPSRSAATTSATLTTSAHPPRTTPTSAVGRGAGVVGHQRMFGSTSKPETTLPRLRR